MDSRPIVRIISIGYCRCRLTVEILITFGDVIIIAVEATGVIQRVTRVATESVSRYDDSC